MQCDIQFQGSKDVLKVDLDFMVMDNSPTQVNYREKTGFLKAATREVYKDKTLIVLWFKILKSQGQLPG